MSTTPHDHAEYVARDLHLAYHRVGDNKPDASFVPWGTLIVTDPAEADRWRWVAKQALPILGQHAANDLTAWAKDHTNSLPAWLRWIVYAILAALAGLGVVKTTGCTSAQQADAAALHRLYHEMTGTECALPTTNSTK